MEALGRRVLVPLMILVNTEATNTTILPIARLTEAELPVALDFRYRMMAESGMAPLLADDWRELTHTLYAEGYRADTIAHFGWRENGTIVATAGVMIRKRPAGCLVDG